MLWMKSEKQGLAYEQMNLSPLEDKSGLNSKNRTGTDGVLKKVILYFQKI